MVYFVNNLRSFVNYAIFRELCDRMRFEVDCAKSYHRVIHNNLAPDNIKNMFTKLTILSTVTRLDLLLMKIILLNKLELKI